MKTPIYDFCKKYAEQDYLRLHMPGHKGVSFLGVESLDITEVDGADSLFEADGIIALSEENASSLFGANTFYSTEGSSLCIRTMLYLACVYAKERGQNPKILAGRNAHKSFLSAAAMLDFDIEWIFGSVVSYLSFNVNSKELDALLENEKGKTTAVYLTSPDYLGNMCDIKEISAVCKKHGVLLLVDNAHGAYLKFLNPSLHPIDLGASMCCDSAHKTLPSLTGGAYLHISHSIDQEFCGQVKNAMSLFATTSPSYLILESLDLVNKYLEECFEKELEDCIKRVNSIKCKLREKGIEFLENEPLKLTLMPKTFGYTGEEFAEILLQGKIMSEFKDPDFTVLMFTPQNSEKTFFALEKIIENIPKRNAVLASAPLILKPEKKMSIREAVFSPKEEVYVGECEGRILANVSVSCPPAVPIVVSGEIIDKKALDVFRYYGIERCVVVK